MSRVSLATGLALMELCALYPWVLLVSTWVSPQRPLVSFAGAALLVLGGAAATLVAQRVLGARRTGQVTLVALGVLLILVLLRAEHYADSSGLEYLGALAASVAVVVGQVSAPPLALLLGIGLWWRGVRLASTVPAFENVEDTFRWGTIALVAFAVLAALGPQRLALTVAATPLLVGFFFVSLLTLALARLESLRSRTRALSINMQWLGALIGVAGVLVLAALIVAQLVSFDLLLLATRPLFELLGRALLILLYLVFIPLAFVIEWLIYTLRRLLRLDEDAPPPQPLEPAQIDSILQRLFNEVIPADVLAVLKALGAALVLVLVLALVARTVGRWRPRAAGADPVEEERESVWPERSLRQLLLAWLRSLFARRAQPVATQPVGVATTTEGRLPGEPVSVRALYRTLLRQGAAAGAPRSAAATPFEHVPALERRLDSAEDIASLTGAYVQVRYADDALTPTELADLQATLARIHAKPADTASGS